MDLYVDTANIEDIKELVEMGIVDGCTTNPEIVAKEGCAFESRMKEILKVVPGPVSIEVTTNDYDTMIEEAVEYSKWGKNAVIKVPVGAPGLKAVKNLKEKEIKTNMTCCMSPGQCILAAKAGATYVSIFFGRIGDMGYNAFPILKETVDIFDSSDFESKIIAASIRTPYDAMSCSLAEAEILTMPPSVFKKMIVHPKTDEAVERFLQFWADYKAKGNKK